MIARCCAVAALLLLLHMAYRVYDLGYGDRPDPASRRHLIDQLHELQRLEMLDKREPRGWWEKGGDFFFVPTERQRRFADDQHQREGMFGLFKVLKPSFLEDLGPEAETDAVQLGRK